MVKVLLGISGGSCSGKTTFAKMLMQRLDSCSIVFQDSYYIDQSDKFDVDGGAVNFDHVKSIDWDLFLKHLRKIKNGENVDLPIYDFSTHKRLNRTEVYKPTEVVIVDGTLIFHLKKMRDIFDETVFLDATTDVRFERRLRRDTSERSRSPDGVRNQFYKQVEPMHEKYVLPTMNLAKYVFDGENLTQERASFLLGAIQSKLK